MNAQSVYTLPETVTTISLYEYGGEWWTRRVIALNDKNYSRCIEWTMLYIGKDYDKALSAYNQACTAQSFLPDNKTSESGQAGILFIIAIVAIVVCLWIAYTGISEASTGTNNMFGYMLSRLGEVLR